VAFIAHASYDPASDGTRVRGGRMQFTVRAPTIVRAAEHALEYLRLAGGAIEKIEEL
jgi:hypothetical protein